MKKWFHLCKEYLSNLLFALVTFTEKNHLMTFTYYIPGPPPRKTGYQEKEFDHILESILALGAKIKHMKTESHVGPEQSGVWVFFLLQGSLETLKNIRQLQKHVVDSPAETSFALELSAEDATESLETDEKSFFF